MLRLTFLSLFSITLFASALNAGMHEDLMSFTKNRPAKVVWARSLAGGFMMAPDFNKQTILMGYNSSTKTTDTICKDVTNYQHPLITKYGNQIIYSDGTDSSIYSVDWDGKNKKKIARGVAGTLWYNTTLGKEYVIYKKGGGMQDKNPIYKLNLSDTSDNTLLLDTTATQFTTCTPVWMGVSSDLKYIFFGLTWPTMRLFDIAAKQSKSSMTGCYGTMPYDTSYRTITFDDSHFGFNLKNTFTQQVPDNLPVITDPDDGTLDHLKFASYSDSVLCVIKNSAPSTVPGNVILYKLNKTFTSITDTVEVTNIYKDGLPDFWVEPPSNAIYSSKHKSIKIDNAHISVDGNLLSIAFDQNKLSNVHIEIFGINGKLLKSKTLNTMNNMSVFTVAMDSFKLSQGLYTVKVTTDNRLVATAVIPVTSRY